MSQSMPLGRCGRGVSVVEIDALTFEYLKYGGFMIKRVMLSLGLCIPMFASANAMPQTAAVFTQPNQAMMAVCSTASCSFSPVFLEQYGCLLDHMEKLVLDNGGKVYEWPDKTQPGGDAKFGIGTLNFEMTINYNEPSTVMSAVIKKKPASIPYGVMWTYVQTELTNCEVSGN